MPLTDKLIGILSLFIFLIPCNKFVRQNSIVELQVFFNPGNNNPDAHFTEEYGNIYYKKKEDQKKTVGLHKRSVTFISLINFLIWRKIC